MPNAINPDDYNIDSLNTGSLGPILTTDFRDYVLGHNLEDINPQVVNGGYNLGGLNVYAGDLHQPTENVQDLLSVSETANLPLGFLNNLSPYESNMLMNLHYGASPYSYTIGTNTILTSPSQGVETFEVQTKKLQDPGNTGSWKLGSGGEETAKSVREKMIQSRAQFSKNYYGPDYIYAYNCPSVPPEETGFVQYKTFAGGDFRSGILGQQLGFGPAAGIEYDSDLSDIGKDQRKFNIKERVKLNFISDTLGKINADPFGLLAGQDLITRDYTITQAPGFGGKALEFTQSLLGFNIPTSIIPTWKSAPGNSGDDISTDLLDFTAGGTKTLLFNAIELNKWGPNFVGNEKDGKEKGKIGKFIEKLDNALDQLGGSGQPPQSTKYTDEITTTTQIEDSREGSGDSLVEKLNNGVKKLVDGLIAGQEPPTLPTEFGSPGPSVDHAEGEKLGYNQLNVTYDDEVTMMDRGGFSVKGVTMNLDNMSDITHRETRDAGKHFWSDTNGTRNSFKRGLLKYTQEMVNTETGVKGTGFRYVGAANSSLFINEKNGKHVAKKGFSMGNRVTGGKGDEEVYCRSWTMKNPYSRYEDTIRHSSLTNREKIFSDLSILEDNGMPKIVPYADTYNSCSYTEGDPSKYMLSIENLAWQNTREFNVLPNIEKGPHGGRLMWFPPYDINFTDNTSVNWDSTTFIGRAEPIYTYNNTERTGTLSFTIITDHPSSLNGIRGETQGALAKYFAGCEDLTKAGPFGDLTNNEETIIESDTSEDAKPIEPPPPSSATLSFYFANAPSSGSDEGRTVGGGIETCYEGAIGLEVLDFDTPTPPCVDGDGNPISGKNTSFAANIQAIVDVLLTENGKRYQIITEGFTSALNDSSYNKKLGIDRATSLQDYLKAKLIFDEQNGGFKEIKWTHGSEGSEKTFPSESEWDDNVLRWGAPIDFPSNNESGGQETLTGEETPEQLTAIISNPDAINNRKAVVRLQYNPNIDAFMEEKSSNNIEEVNKERMAESNRAKEREKTIDTSAQKLANQMVNECTYFNKLKVENPFIYDTLEDKIKFFHPAFHSMTPEGLNGRLTFLQQCTRQGPNIAKNQPPNMAFGKPPICVLRVGDFYHTKIVIDSVNFSFDPLQWDLNPEGIGVQPMLAKVDLNFKFIGGSSLGGPINELQNAVSFNFFANTSVYNKRKDIEVTKDKKNSDGQKIGTDTDTFGYGSFITPEQVTGVGNLKGQEKEIQKINLATTDAVVPENQRTEGGVNISEREKQKLVDAQAKQEALEKKVSLEFEKTIIGRKQQIADTEAFIISVVDPYKFDVKVYNDSVKGLNNGNSANSIGSVSEDGSTITFLPLPIGTTPQTKWTDVLPAGNSINGTSTFFIKITGSANVDGVDYPGLSAPVYLTII